MPNAHRRAEAKRARRHARLVAGTRKRSDMPLTPEQAGVRDLITYRLHATRLVLQARRAHRWATVPPDRQAE
jgi:hypothetical protein